MATTTATDSLDQYLTRLYDASEFRSVSALARAAKVSQPTTWRILKGEWKQQPKWENVRPIALALDADLDRVGELYRREVAEAHLVGIPGYAGRETRGYHLSLAA